MTVPHDIVISLWAQLSQKITEVERMSLLRRRAVDVCAAKHYYPATTLSPQATQRI